jgi:transposase
MSRYSLVILVDEYNTSKICSSCQTETLIHPKSKKTYTKTIKENNIKKKISKEVENENYRLCHCTNEIHIHSSETKNVHVHKIWNRDYNASLNILQVMKNKLLGINLGKYTRKKLSENNNCWSLDQLITNESNQTKKLSLKR